MLIVLFLSYNADGRLPPQDEYSYYMQQSDIDAYQDQLEEVNGSRASALTLNVLILVALGMGVIVRYRNVVSSSQNFIDRHAQSLKKSQELNFLYPVLQEIGQKLDVSPDMLVLQTPQNIIFPSVEQYSGNIVLILPLGFFSFMRKHPEEARFILAHELSHIRQQDLHLFRQSEAYGKVLLPLILTIEVLNIFVSFYISHALGSDIQTAGEYFAPFAPPLLMILCVTVAWSSVRQTRFKSEELADWGAALATNKEAGIALFEKIKQQHGLVDERHPGPHERIQFLKEIDQQ